MPGDSRSAPAAALSVGGICALIWVCLTQTATRADPTAEVSTHGLGALVRRGIVFAIAGALVVDAAATYDASKSTGLDGALRTLADRPYGPVLLGLLAAGLITFGVFGFAAARWSKV